MQTTKVIENNQSLEIVYKSINKKATGPSERGFYLTTSQCNYSIDKAVNSFNQFSEHTLSTKIRENVASTLKVITKLYAERLNVFLNKTQFAYKNSYEHPNSLFVAHGIIFFAKHRGLSTRAVQNHLKKLEELGFIIRENTYTQVKIFINPEVLISYDQNKLDVDFIKHKLAEKFKKEEQEYSKEINSENQTVIQTKTTKWRTRYMTHSYNKKINEKVNKSNTFPNLPSVKVNNQGQDTPQSDNKKNINLKAAEKRARYFKDIEELKKIKQLKHQKKVQKKAVELWRIAFTNLYEPKIGKDYNYISYYQEQYTINYFKNQLSNTINHNELREKFDFLKHRLKMWEDFIKNPKINGFTPLPKSFFNVQNKNGFEITLIWFYKNKQKHKYNQVFKTLTKKAREVSQLFTKNSLSFSDRITIIKKQIRWKDGYFYKIKEEQKERKDSIKLTSSQFKFLNQYFIQRVNEAA